MPNNAFDKIVDFTWSSRRKGEPWGGGLPHDAPLILRLDHIELGALDLWIEDQPGRKLSRAQAARKLIHQALVR